MSLLLLRSVCVAACMHVHRPYLSRWYLYSIWSPQLFLILEIRTLRVIEI